VRFDIVVPAHNESGGIASTVSSLLALDYPRSHYRILVVADNCTDETAAVATAAGANALVRNDENQRGKGYALAFAFERILAEGFAEAVVVVDADTLVAPASLRAFASKLAAGESALQARYGVRNRDASWRTRLMCLALALFHDTRSLGRERLRVSCGLRGNGMVFRADVLRRVGYSAFSIVEDMEYGFALAEAGVRVAWVDGALVLGEMASTEEASRSQRQRWEGGRLAMLRQALPRLLRGAFAWRDPIRLDLALDLLVPPLSTLALATGAGLVLAVALALARLASPWATIPFALATLCLLVHVARGFVLSGLGWRGLLDLGHVPLYILWKLTLPLRGRRGAAGEWIRTRRDHEAS
jgi:cellulose synthase/poly-beta-1,6-N-acetylglucosamine synthase-like glycosyltransferase